MTAPLGVQENSSAILATCYLCKTAKLYKKVRPSIAWMKKVMKSKMVAIKWLQQCKFQVHKAIIKINMIAAWQPPLISHFLIKAFEGHTVLYSLACCHKLINIDIIAV